MKLWGFRLMKDFYQYAERIQNLRYAHMLGNSKETWNQIARRVCYWIVGKGRSDRIRIYKDIVREIEQAIIQRKLIPGGRILANAGREYHQTNNCYTLRAKDTREGWAELNYKATMMMMSGGGIGVEYSNIRPYGTPLKRTGGIASGPIPAIRAVDAIGDATRQGGERRGAIHAALKWNHPDIEDFIKLKENGGLEHTNISVRYDNNWLSSINSYHNDLIPQSLNSIQAYQTFLHNLHYSCKYGDPNFQFDWDNQILRNACTEIISEDDCDPCCLASLNFSKITSLQELSDITQLGIIFLLAATEYSHDPMKSITQVKEKNRRLGLGIMGLAEWFIQRNMKYGEINSFLEDNPFETTSLRNWMQVYKGASDSAADKYSSEFNMSRPIAVRAIAPTGTISIVGGHTTPGIEPLFCLAYRRTYNTLKEKEYQLGLQSETVIDPIVSKLIEDGYSEKELEKLDTAWKLSSTTNGIERRLSLQAFMQQYVDNAISSTINLPKYEEGYETLIAPILLKYLPKLRGVTFYPDGARANQPIQPVSLSEALKSHTIQESEYCKGGVCGI